MQCAGLGAELRVLQGFSRDPVRRFRNARLEGHGNGRMLNIGRPSDIFVLQNEGRGYVRINDGLRIENVLQSVWEFKISGYQVAYKWLDARDGLSLDLIVNTQSGETLQRQMLDLFNRLEEYLHLCDQAEPLLEDAIANALSLQDLNLDAENQGQLF